MYIFTDETLRYLISKIKSQIAPKKSLDNKVDKVDGKVLSDNDFTNSAKQILETKYDSVRVENSTGKSNIIFSNESLDVKTIELKTSCDMFFYPNIDETLFANLNGDVILPYAFISKSGSAIGNITVDINNLTTGTNANYVFEVIDGKNNEVELQGVSAGDVKLTFTIEGNTEELKANVLKEYSTVIMLPLTIYRSTNPSLIPSNVNVSNVKTVVSDFGNGEYEIMLYTATSTNYINFSNVKTLTNVSYISDSITNMANTYNKCTNLTGNPICGDKVTDMSYTYANCYNLTGSPVCGPNVTNMSKTYDECNNLTGSPVCGPNVTNMSYTYYKCTNLTGNPVCGDNVTNMKWTYYNCYNLTGSPVCGPNVTSMGMTYYNCRNLTGSPVCGDKVTSMDMTYHNCRNLTGNPVYGNNVTYMSSAYDNCFNLTGSPVCGPNVTYMSNTYYNCYNLTGNPVCGPNVTDMRGTYAYCSNLTGNPVCGENVTDMRYTYSNCYNLTGSPVCGPNVTDMRYTYDNCTNLTGSPVCGNNVTNMYNAYRNCSKLTGNPVCGDKVKDMFMAYTACKNLTGSPVCGPNVTNMYLTYSSCYNLTGAPVCGPNVTTMHRTYFNCQNLHGDFYVYSNNVSDATNCFYGRDNSRRLNIFVNKNTTSYNTLVRTNSATIIGSNITWTSNASWSCMYNTYYNIYIYPVDDVAQASKTTIRKSLTAAETANEWNLETDIDWDTEYLEIETDNNRWYGEKLTANMNIYSGMFFLGEGDGFGSPNTIVFNNKLNDLFITDSDAYLYLLNMSNFDMSKASHYIFKIDRTGITAKAFTDTGESTGFLAINTDSFSTYLSEIFALSHIKISGAGNYNSDIEIRVIKY